MSELKVYYDFQIMHMQKYGGISRYFYDLIENIEEQNLADIKVDCLFNINEYFMSRIQKPSFLGKEPLRGGAFLNRVNTFRNIKYGYDIIHPTYYDPYILKAKKAKIVITIYDMIHEKFPELFPADDVTVEYKKRLIYGSDHIIAISNSTKRDILELYPDIREDKISVIYLASNMKKYDIAPTNNLIPKKYVLFVGRRDKYKNFMNFFRGIEDILIGDSSINLVCAGGGNFTIEEKELFGVVSNQIQQIDASDELLSYLYSNAICFVFPSLYEGFGIPTLEAFRCNCPVVLSDTSSMPEVGGDAVVYINPGDIRDIGDKIKRLISNPTLREQLIIRGQERLTAFTWENIARQTVDCYKKIL